MINITGNQLTAHVVGDYILQSDWMATEKTKRSLAAIAHVATYFLPFLALTTSWKALLFIAGTHFIIDRWRLARYICWAKNFLAPRWITPTGAVDPVTLCYPNRRDPSDPLKGGVPVALRNYSWERCQGTGYAPDKPPLDECLADDHNRQHPSHFVQRLRVSVPHMTPVQLFAIIDKYEDELQKLVTAARIPSSSSGPQDAEALAHVLWMCEQTKLNAQTDMEKACRWLGFIQGVLWMTGVRNITEMRDENSGS